MSLTRHSREVKPIGMPKIDGLGLASDPAMQTVEGGKSHKMADRDVFFPRAAPIILA